MQRDNKDILATPIMFKDEEIRELRALKEHSDKRIELLEHRCSQYSRLCQQHVKNLQKKNDEIAKLKIQLKDEINLKNELAITLSGLQDM
tara:strand:- start:1672 stop:1941 length:270 start_codon:yes stop_codon:yes gene_type:complete